MIDGILETCLYAEDLAAAEKFYSEVLGLSVLGRAEGRHVFFRCGASVLLLFNASRTSTAAGEVAGVPVPTHGASGSGHVCFRIAEASLDHWRARLAERAVTIEAEIQWPSGGKSLYVRDPAGNSVEFAPARIWGLV